MAKKSKQATVIDGEVIARETSEVAATTQNAVTTTKESTTLAAIGNATNPMMILKSAVEGGADIATINSLMDLSDRWEANQARKAFNNAIADMRGELRPILKKSKVDYENKNAGSGEKPRTNYNYEELADIAEHVDPLLSKYGLSYRYRFGQSPGRVTVICILSHRDGYFEENALSAPEDTSGKKNAVQSIGSTVTYLERYTLKGSLGLSATKDDDGNGGQLSAPEPVKQIVPEKPRITAEHTARLMELIKETKSDMQGFLKWLSVETIDDILDEHFGVAEAALLRKIDEKPPTPTRSTQAAKSPQLPQDSHPAPTPTRKPAEEPKAATEGPSAPINPERLFEELEAALNDARLPENVSEAWADIVEPHIGDLFQSDIDWLMRACNKCRAELEDRMRG